MIRNALFLAVLTGLLGACTWVKLEPAGKAIRVAASGEDLVHCDRRGEVTVAVKHNVAFIERNPLKVRDELETMARNEAPNLSADTVQPIDEPLYGEQRFVAFTCGSRTAAPKPAQPLRETEAETFPVR